jgi:hypothetical protein
VRLHGLRMLNPEVFSRLPFASADSTNIGRNIGIDQAWRGTTPAHERGPRRCHACAHRIPERACDLDTLAGRAGS